MEQKDWTYALPGSHQEELQVSGEKMASRAWQAWLLRRQHQFQAMANAKVEDLDVTLDNSVGFADGPWWMIGYRCVIYEWSELRLGPLVLGDQWEQYQKQRILLNINAIRSDIEDKRLYCTRNQEVRYRTFNSRGLRSKGRWKKINSKRYPSCIQ